MIVHVWDPIHCVLRLAWRNVAQARRLKPLTLAATLACGPGAGPPPPEPHVPPQPPANVWTPPPGPVGSFPPAWGWQPPTGAPPAEEIPLGPVLDFGPGPQETDMGIPITEQIQSVSMPPGVRVPVPPCPVPETPPHESVPEPAGIAVVGMALLGLGLVRRKA